MDSTLKRFISFITVLILSCVFSLAALAAENSPAESKGQKAVKKTAVEKKQPPVKQEVQAGKAKAKSAPAQPKAEAVLLDDSYLKDRDLLDRLQRDTFRYMWEHTYKESGLAYEDSRNKATGQATTGGTGFGIAAIVAAAERGWVTREDAVARILKISKFLRDKTDRKNLHGAFPHWLDGRTGRTFSFSE